MIKVYFEVRCDYCGSAINHYDHRPTMKELDKDEISIMIGRPYKHSCKECSDIGRRKYLEITKQI